MSKLFTLFLGCLMLPCLLAGDAPFSQEAHQHAAKLRELGLKDKVGYELVKSLTVEVGPRMAGSEGDKRAVVWAERKLRELGFDHVALEPVEVTHWVRGPEHAWITAPYPQVLHITALGHSVGTEAGGLEADVLMVPDLETLKKQKPADVQGKIVFINHRTEKAIDGSGYGKTVPGRANGAVQAAKLGAVGLVIRSVGTDSHRFAHTGVMQYQDDIKRIPAGAISNPDADMVQAQIESGKTVRLKMKLDCQLIGKTMSANVIGEIKGRELPDEVVVIGGHLDSWDLGTGALDDGAGVGITMAAAKLIADSGKRPKRTIRVVLFANEESGLEGSRQYVIDHQNDLEKIIIGAESDFGAGKIWRFDTRIDESFLPVADAIAKALAPLGIKRGGNEAYGGPDMIPFRMSGVPVVSLLQDGTDYFDFHHTADDTFDKIDPKAMSQNVAAYAVFAYLAAESPAGFGRLEVSAGSH